MKLLVGSLSWVVTFFPSMQRLARAIFHWKRGQREQMMLKMQIYAWLFFPSSSSTKPSNSPGAHLKYLHSVLMVSVLVL